MLVLKLKASDRVQIGDATVDVRDIGNGRVRLAIDAPRNVPIKNMDKPVKVPIQGVDTTPSD